MFPRLRQVSAGYGLGAHPASNRVVKPLQQHGPLLTGSRQMASLDMAVTADLLRQAGKCHCRIAITGIELRQETLHGVFVFLHQRALMLTLFGIAENVERPTTQHLQGC